MLQITKNLSIRAMAFRFARFRCVSLSLLN
jgi:hypothetical protein